MPIIPNNTPFVLLTNVQQPDKGTANGQHTYNKRNRSTATCVQCPFLIVPECLRCPPNQVCSVSVQTCDTCPGFSCIDVAETYINNTDAQSLSPSSSNGPASPTATTLPDNNTNPKVSNAYLWPLVGGLGGGAIFILIISLGFCFLRQHYRQRKSDSPITSLSPRMPTPPAFELAEKSRLEPSGVSQDQVLPTPVVIPAVAAGLGPPGTRVTGLLKAKMIPNQDKTGENFWSIETDKLPQLQEEEQLQIKIQPTSIIGSTPEAKEKLKGKAFTKLNVETTTNTTKIPIAELVLERTEKANTSPRSCQKIEYPKAQRHHEKSKHLISSLAGDAIKGDTTDTTPATADTTTSFANADLIPTIQKRSISAPTPMNETHIYTSSTTRLLLPEIPPNKPLTLSKAPQAITTSLLVGLQEPSCEVLKQQQLPLLTTQQHQEQKHDLKQYLGVDYETKTKHDALRNLIQQQAPLPLPSQPSRTSELKVESISIFDDIISEEGRVLKTVLPPGPLKPTPYDRFLFKIKMQMYENRHNASRTSSLIHMGLEEDSSDSALSTSVQPPFTYLHVPSGLTSNTNDKGLSEINRSYDNRDNPDFSKKDAASSPQVQPYDKGTEIICGDSAAIASAHRYPHKFSSNTGTHLSQGQHSKTKTNTITGDNTTAIATEQVTTDSVLFEQIEALLDLGGTKRLSSNSSCRSSIIEKDADWALTRNTATTTTTDVAVATNVNQAQPSRDASQQQGHLNCDKSFNINTSVNKHMDARRVGYPVLYGSRKKIQYIFPPTTPKRKPQKKS